MLILAVILTAYSGFLFLTFRHTLYQEMNGTLTAKALKINNAVTSYIDVLGYDEKSFEFSVSRVISQTGTHPHKNKIEKLERLWLGQSAPLGIGADYIEFLDASGNLLVRSTNLRAPAAIAVYPEDVKAVSRGHAVFRDLSLGKEELRLGIFPAAYDRLPGNKKYMILVASSRQRVINILRERLLTTCLSIVIILLLATFLSQLFAKNVLRPLAQITEKARNIDYKDLSFRIKTEEMDLEVKDLVNALNEMLSRLEKSFKYIAEFSSHVSHELKTPLAILRGETELALRLDHSPEEYKQVLQGNLEELARMAKIIDDLLLLTKLDYQPHIFKLENFDLSEFFGEIGESAKLLAGDKEIDVQVETPPEPILLHGDRMHLRRLFFNLLNNAIKFTPPKGHIRLGMKRQNGMALVTFTDNGIGIPEQNIGKVFDKFFHAGPGQGAQGNGLGLSIAQAIAKIHSGRISVKSREGQGTTFTVILPLQPAAAA